MTKRAAAGDISVTPDMVTYCFDVLIHHFKGGHAPTPTFDVDIECPMFVTWEKDGRNGGHRHLRGCIGTLSPKRLSALKDYVFSSAFRDRRFSPISESEVPQLRCSVSLLVNYEDGDDVYDWEVGVHGIIINFKDRHGECYNATYLPEVSSEQRWSKAEALDSLARKAGYTGKLTDSFWKDVQLTRYQSSKHTMHYTEFVAHMETEKGAMGFVVEEKREPASKRSLFKW